MSRRTTALAAALYISPTLKAPEHSPLMSRRTTALAAALSVLVLGSPLMTGCSDSAGNIHFTSAALKHERGNYQGAIADFSKAIRLQKARKVNRLIDDAYGDRGLAKYYLKDYQGAIADYSKAIAINPQLAFAYKNRGIAKELIDDLQGACADWRKASSLGNTYAAGWVRKQCQ